ncbi:hypothetical protein POM88_047831 [Heracleum sosnowskyi]|uniref:Uncharacterized protein n=1 Tax=Heracleum sosnowskyi TaxID=360622 RepID=A0AAD8GSS0_9APIA|nr:hypothetical protein POM88_047831 [Heracleum sosnowskyi]
MFGPSDTPNSQQVASPKASQEIPVNLEDEEIKGDNKEEKNCDKNGKKGSLAWDYFNQKRAAQLDRPSLEKGSVEDILDANLLLEPCNIEVMLKMGQLGLRCVVKVPKQRPTMTQVGQELEAALHVADTYIPKHPIKCRLMGVSHGSMVEHDDFESGVEFQRFHVDMDTDHSANLRCLVSSAVSIEIDKVISRGIRQQMSISMDEELSIPRD